MTNNNENRADGCAHEDALAPRILDRQDQTESKRRISDKTFAEILNAELYKRRMWRVIESIDPSDSGHFFDCDGGTVPW